MKHINNDNYLHERFSSDIQYSDPEFEPSRQLNCTFRFGIIFP